MAGSEHGSAKTVADLHEIVGGLPGRVARQRSTTYGTVSAERITAADRYDGTLPGIGARLLPVRAV
jgi:FO synthase